MRTIYENNLEDLVRFIGKAEVYPVITTVPGDLITPLAAYCALSGSTCGSFLFESVEGGEHLARYSFIGADPEFIVRDTGAGLSVTAEGRNTVSNLPILQFLRERLPKLRFPDIDGLPGFLGGAVGFLDFSVASQIEPSSAHDTPERDGFCGSEFMFFRRVIAFDHVRQTVSVVSLVFRGDADGDPKALSDLIHETAQTNELTARSLLSPSPGPRPFETNPVENGAFESNFARNDFETAVESVKELIAAGECYQVVISQRFSRKTPASPLEIYRALRSLNPSPYMFLMEFGDRAVVGASPEMLVRLRNGKLEYRPIAGTRPRSRDRDEDVLLAAEMLKDEKELAEHCMLVDLGRSDLGRVSEYGTVKVDDLMSVERFSHVQHIVSSISARLRKDLDGVDAIESCFPAGTVSGAPKVRALRIIGELEPTARGVYSGAVGYFDYQGNLDTCIAIRTVLLENGVAKIQAGAGIVADSVPSKEYEETVHKAAALIRAVELAETGRFALAGQDRMKKEAV